MFIDFLNGMSIEEMSDKYRITRKAVGCIIDKKNSERMRHDE